MSLIVVLLVSLAVSSLLLPGTPPRRGGDGVPRSAPAPSDGNPTQLRRGTGQPEHSDGARFDWRQWTVRLGGFAALTCGLVVIPARPAAADNCSGLSDCSFGVKIALAVAAIALVALLIFLLPELLGAGAAAGAAAGEAVAAEAAAAAALAGAEAAVVAEAATAGAVTAEAAVAAGTVTAGGKLAAVLGALESAWAAAAPTNAIGALQAIATATASVGLEPGIVAGTTAGGTIVLNNVGGVTTYIFNTGQVLIMRGSDVLLNLVR
jgi:hypothetical protein